MRKRSGRRARRALERSGTAKREDRGKTEGSSS